MRARGFRHGCPPDLGFPPGGFGRGGWGPGFGRGLGRASLLEAAVLARLARAPKHGYDLRKEVDEFTAGFVAVDPGGLYRLLRRLEQEGFIRSSWAEGEFGPQRREYEITDEGLELLSEWGEVLRWRERAYRSVIEAIEEAIGQTGESSAKAQAGEERESGSDRDQNRKLDRQEKEDEDAE